MNFLRTELFGYVLMLVNDVLDGKSCVEFVIDVLGNLLPTFLQLFQLDYHVFDSRMIFWSFHKANNYGKLIDLPAFFLKMFDCNIKLNTFFHN